MRTLPPRFFPAAHEPAMNAMSLPANPHEKAAGTARGFVSDVLGDDGRDQ
jgi:hypothetical protein